MLAFASRRDSGFDSISFATGATTELSLVLIPFQFVSLFVSLHLVL